MTKRAIEKALRAQPGVIEARVLNRSEMDPEKALRAFVALREADKELLQSFCESCRRPSQKVLGEVEIHVLSAVPKTRTGAVARRQLVAVIDSKNA